MKTLLRFIAAAAAALLCLHPGLKAQTVSVSPTSLTWAANNTSEQAVYVSAGYGVSWTVSVSGSAFVADATDGEGSDFIHVAPAAANTGNAALTAVLTVSTGGSSAQVSLTQYAPATDPVELISLAGNWTISRTYTNAAGSASFEDITFYDGLGYAEQVVQVGASPSGGKNIVTPVWYDSMRRADARTYLPYVSTNTTRVEESTSSVLTNQAAWYNGNGWSGQGSYAFAEQEYEASPLDRVLKARKPGSTYAKAVSGSKYVQMAYGANAASEVRKLSVNASGQLVADGYYPAGTLHKTTATDEDDCVTVTWTDKLGRTVLTRQVSDSNVNMDTYYVYDNAGRLCWVVTPVGSSNALGNSGTWALPSDSDINTSSAARYCYIYTWDGRGRQLTRKIPGKAVEEFVYDRAGRLVMSRDGLQRAAGKWVTCKYDAQGRLVRRALLTPSTYSSVFTSYSRAQFQTFFDNGSATQINGLLSAGTVLEQYDYGSYANAGSSSGLTFAAVSGVVASTDVDQSRIKGLKTWEKVAILSGTGVPSTYVQRAFYYDALGRLVQTVEKNAMGTTSRYSTKYDFLGNVTASREQHGTDYKTGAFTYDGRGRLLSETTNVNGTTATMAYAYDPLGRLKTTTSGSGTGAVTTTDSWNIQGWLASRTAKKGTANIFTMSLGYYSPTVSGPVAKYSGDISSWTWTQSGQGAKSYGFTYDGAHRLTDGQYYTGSGTSASSTNALSEKSISYDRNGNVTALTRYNNSGSGTTLSYSYAGNRLSSIGSASYAYDADGNLSADGRRGLSLTYNLMGLPAGVTATVGGAAKASYSFLSDGTKAGVVNGSAGYWYLGTFTYSRSNTLESVAFGGGRIRKTGTSSYAVDYHITDHLGSVRAIVNASGTIQEQNDYYPFGTRHPNGLTQLSGNRWRYSGKEDQVTGSLGYLDYGARFYDPVVARWNAPDPLADAQTAFSPYAFCAGNPILFLDKEGEILETAWDVASLAMGVKSFVEDVKQGKVGAAIVDGLGIVGDAAAVLAPCVPGGIGAGVMALRAGRTVDKAVDAAKAVDKTMDAAKAMDKATDATRELNKAKDAVKGPKTYQTYRKVNPETGEVYIGRTSGTGSPEANVRKRDKNHHMNQKGFLPAELLNTSSNPDAIRGQEQFLIELNGGAKSVKGKSGNAINGVSPKNPKRHQYEEARLKEFGQ